MDKELDLLKPLIAKRDKMKIEGVEFHTGEISGREVVVCHSGIGKVNAALTAETMLRNFNPALVINTGVAGGTGGGASILDVVVGAKVAYHDVWCGPGTLWGEAHGCPLYFECPDFLKRLPALEPSEHLIHGLICSGDIFVSDVKVLDGIRRHFPDVVAVDMESAAIAQTCYMKDVPFMALRVISDTPGAADNLSQYNNFWEDAPKKTFKIIETLVAQV